MDCGWRSTNIFWLNAAQSTMSRYLLCHSREFKDISGLIIHGDTLVNVNNHAGFASATEEALQVVGQLAFPEGNVLTEPGRENRFSSF